MDILASHKLITSEGFINIADVLNDKEYIECSLDLPNDDVLLYMKESESTAMLAIVAGDQKITVSAYTKIETTKGWVEARYLNTSSSLIHKLPTPLIVSEIRRLVGTVKTVSLFTKEGKEIKLDNGVVISTLKAPEPEDA